jgi:hypothetical protein
MGKKTHQEATPVRDAGGTAYTAEDITVLKGLEAVRRRPADRKSVV